MVDSDDDSIANPIRRRFLNRFRGCWMLYLSFVLGIAGLSIFSWLDRVAPIWRAKKLLAEAGPPDGATREQVQAWLDRQRIRSWSVSSLDDRGDYPAVQAPQNFEELSPAASGGYIVGIISSPYWYGWKRQIWIYFFFDSEGCLIQRIIKSWSGYT